MLLLLVGILKAMRYDYHKDIKILTENRDYELTLTPDSVFQEKIMFLPTTPYNKRENIFTYDTEYGGIKTMFNEFLTKDIQLSSGVHFIKPSITQMNVDDWRIKGLSHYNTIKNSRNYCFKLGKHHKELDGYELKAEICSVSDEAQRFIVVEIPRKHDDVCSLLNTSNSSCSDDYLLTGFDVRERPMLLE